jgi:hypothetical protein
MVAIQVKLAKVMRVEISGLATFPLWRTRPRSCRSSKERAGTEGRKLFEKFVHDLEKLEAPNKRSCMLIAIAVEADFDAIHAAGP